MRNGRKEESYNSSFSKEEGDGAVDNFVRSHIHYISTEASNEFDKQFVARLFALHVISFSVLWFQIESERFDASSKMFHEILHVESIFFSFLSLLSDRNTFTGS